jgi:hypothetical protein
MSRASVNCVILVKQTFHQMVRLGARAQQMQSETRRYVRVPQLIHRTIRSRNAAEATLEGSWRRAKASNYVATLSGRACS